MATTTVISGVQYSGIWNISSQANAKAAGTWPLAGGGALYVWGTGGGGRLGLGNTTDYSSPKQLGALRNWLSAAGGYTWSLAVYANNSLWTWGPNSLGQLGLGNTTSYSSPKQVGSLQNWSSNTVAGAYSATSIKTDGTLWTWGYNGDGQLGLGNTTYYSSPKQVGALTNWSKVSSGFYHVLALKTDGTLWAWGKNTNAGQLGDNSTSNKSSPVQVGALTTWLQISGGRYCSYGLQTNGTLWSWGNNAYGQLGLGNTTYYSSPKQVGAGTDWAGVYGAGPIGYHVIAIKNNGTLWAWGRNEYGQLGDGSTTYRSSPVQIGALTTWSSSASGRLSSLAIKTDKTLWSWGFNPYGNLGLGNTTNYSSPKQVGSSTNWLSVAAGSYHVLATTT